MEGILEIETELEVDALRDPEVLLCRHHRVDGSRSGQDIASRIARGKRRWRSERGDVAGWKGAACIGRGRTAGCPDHSVFVRLIEAARPDDVPQSKLGHRGSGNQIRNASSAAGRVV